MVKYIVVFSEFILLTILAIVMFKSIANRKNSLALTILVYVVSFIACLLLFPNFEKRLNVFNEIYLNYYAVFLAIINWTIFLATIIISIYKRLNQKSEK